MLSSRLSPDRVARKRINPPKFTTPKNPLSPSTTNDLNPKLTNTFDRPPSPILEDNHDAIEDNPPSSPPNNPTYKEVVTKSSDTAVNEKSPPTSFRPCKNLHDRSLEEDFSDEVTISNGSSGISPEYIN